ncbi:hypothetical protein ONS96_009334 [Cadophora gregata f. sp. sojae]|nr:hypothetical protein ONS96_009334 [Cadophora gregata f. sp. sojae]
MIIGLIWLGLKYTGRFPQQDKPTRVLNLQFKAAAMFLFLSALVSEGRSENKEACNDCPKPFIPPPPLWLHRGKIMAVIWYFIAAIYSGFWFSLLWICRRWPVVASALLIEQPSADPGEGGQHSDPPIPQPSLIDFEAWVSLCFFLTNIVVVVLWYAFIYDSTGTANPPWTDIFGK